MEKLTVGLFNDSFPPTIDGVANVTVNYADVINRELGRAVVAVPHYPHVQDDYPFKVVRYPSAYVPKAHGYRAGYPFDPLVLRELEKEELNIIHSHCPVVSTVLARTLRRIIDVPIVFTYHTKFDIDIENLTASDKLRRMSLKFLLQNIEACDEVWVVSNGAGENLRSIGYTGDYRVMQNGTDFERRRASQQQITELRRRYGIQTDETVFLFVGRMMWYKGVKLSLDGLARAKAKGAKFRFLLVGDGTDKDEIGQYIRDLGLETCCTMVGAVHDRELLRTFFSAADLFLFPSTFDTNGIVVREAAACSCPSLMICGSCAAEGITDGKTGILIDQTPEAMCDAVVNACADRNRLRQIGENAASEIYISWDTAVRAAYDRYGEVIEHYRSSGGRKHHGEERMVDMLGDAVVEVADSMIQANEMMYEHFEELYWSTADHLRRLKEMGREGMQELFSVPRGK